MTENRCIEVLKKMKHMFTETCAKIDDNTALDMAVEAVKEIQQYRALEQKLQSVYGEHDGLLEIVVNNIVKFDNAPDKAIKAVLLTDDDVDKWEQYKEIGTVEEFKALKNTDIPIIHGKAELDLHDREVRNKAIDEFMERIMKGQIYGIISIPTVEVVAKQLKGEKQ